MTGFTPIRCMYTYEVHAYEVCASEVHVYEKIHAYEMHTRKVHEMNEMNAYDTRP